MARLGGITYGRLLDGIEIPRPDWDEMRPEAERRGLVQPKTEGQ